MSTEQTPLPTIERHLLTNHSSTDRTLIVTRRICLFVLAAYLCRLAVCSQNDAPLPFRVVCYNVENYFDCQADSVADDSEYLPGGMRGWNYTRYLQKQANIAKVVAAIAGWDTPALIALCEVESRKALDDLTRYSPLQTFGYKYLHFDSPDVRGIDVALLYHPYRFFPVEAKAIPTVFPNPNERPTRDILCVTGTTMYDDTLHVLVYHAPSRSGGVTTTLHRRLHAAKVLRHVADSLLATAPASNILIMGDFNDYPTDESLTEVLQARPLPDSCAPQPRELYNLAYELHTQGKGSYKYEGEWGMFDQIIVSGNLLDKSNTLYTGAADFHLMEESFLLEKDDRYLGMRPFRTYRGARYLGGYSDHLPVYIDLYTTGKKSKVHAPN